MIEDDDARLHMGRDTGFERRDDMRKKMTTTDTSGSDEQHEAKIKQAWIIDDPTPVMVIFCNDPRVVEMAKLSMTIVPSSTEDANAMLRIEVEKLWDSGSRGKQPMSSWYREALVLAEREGKPWDAAPGLLEAVLSRQGEPLTPVGFPLTVFLPGECKPISTQPQVPVKPLRLVLQAGRLEDLSVDDIRVGKNSCMANSCPAPATMFAPTAFPVVLSCDVCNIAQSLSLFITNNGHEKMQVQALILGRTAPGYF